MSSVLKLCGVLAVFAIAVLANPIAQQLDDATVSSSTDENTDSTIVDATNEVQAVGGAFETTEKDQSTTEMPDATVAPSPSVVPTSAVQSLDAADASQEEISGRVLKIDFPSTTKAPKQNPKVITQASIPNLSKSVAPSNLLFRPETQAEIKDKSTARVPRNSESTTEAASSTTAPNESSMTSPNRMSIAAALMLMVIVKMCATY